MSPRIETTRTVIEEARSLERARRICALLRAEGLLGRTPEAVLHLADRLLASLALR